MSYTDGTRYKLVDENHNTWACEKCGYIETFEADGPFENGWEICPHCGRHILEEDGE